MISEQEIVELLKNALMITKKAGELTLSYYQQSVEVISKADDSPVTIADRKAEELIREFIMKNFPSHQIVGEEFGNSGEDSDFKWIIDPIDGTKSFISGVPLYSNLLGIEYRGRMVVGVCNFPALKEIIYAGKGSGCFWNGKPTKVSETETISQSRLMTTDYRHLEKSAKYQKLKPLLEQCKFHRGWGDAYGHALVATGRAEAMFDPLMNPWDCAPFGVILPEAGGYFGTWEGEETIYGKNACSTTWQLSKIILSALKE